MNQISIRELRNSLSESLKSLPLEITSRGKVIALVIDPKNDVYTNKRSVHNEKQASVHKEECVHNDVSVMKVINKPCDVFSQLQTIDRFNPQGVCKHGAAIGLCKHECNK